MIYEAQLTYKNYKLVDILSKILPKGMHAASSFEMVGTIAHVNLSKNQLPYKNIIGEAIMLIGN